MDYSVVVPTVGERGTLARCLDAILGQTRPPSEVIVAAVEGASVNVADGIRVLHARPSTAGQRNAGARLASAPVVMFVDDDVLLEPQFAESVLDVWERRGFEPVAGVMGTVVNDAWEMRLSRRVLRALLGQSHVAVFSRRTRIMASGNVSFVAFPQEEIDVGFAGTACVAYRRELFVDEAFDEQFDGYVLGEDLDLSARMARRGQIIHTPRARCRHEPVAAGLGEGGRAAWLRGRAYALYRGRHRRPGVVGRLAWEWANFTEASILGARALVHRDPAVLRAFLGGLRDARAQLRGERGPD
jgi:GT2 family glycosyltransferase